MVEGEDCIASGICYVFCIFGRIIQGTKITNDTESFIKKEERKRLIQ